MLNFLIGKKAPLFGILMAIHFERQGHSQTFLSRKMERCYDRSMSRLTHVILVIQARNLTSDDWGAGCAFASGAATTSRREKLRSIPQNAREHTSTKLIGSACCSVALTS
jgi:hypothetical protein